MTPQTAEQLSADLLKGVLGDPWPNALTAAAGLIADRLAASDSGLAAAQVRLAVQALNRRRHFAHTRTVAGAWHDTRGCDPTIQKHHAQALIELGGLDAADVLLAEALQQAQHAADVQFRIETPEYLGLRGRIHKQRYVQTSDVNALVAATDAYLVQYAARPAFWHGVNIVALRAEEERVGLQPRDGAGLVALARQVLEIATTESARNPADHWPLATASEACLAIQAASGGGDWGERAELWLYRFLHHPAADSFSIESYARQLREIWRGNPLAAATGADRLASIIERHVVRTEKRWSIDPAKVQELREHPEVLERNFSGEKSFTIATLRMMLDLCPNIGCVIDAAGTRLGTGFLMHGQTFGFSQPLVFVTNAHVISDTVEGAISPAQAKVTFETESAAAGAPVAHGVGQVLFTSPPGDLSELSETLDKLDVTIVALNSAPAGVAGLPPAANVPLPSPTSKAFVVGHPASGALQFSLHDSVLLDVCPHERLLHYRTPTDPGSSGSPVFNARWQVMALHHAGSPSARRLNGEGHYEANEGITMRAIRRKLGVD